MFPLAIQGTVSSLLKDVAHLHRYIQFALDADKRILQATTGNQDDFHYAGVKDGAAVLILFWLPCDVKELGAMVTECHIPDGIERYHLHIIEMATLTIPPTVLRDLPVIGETADGCLRKVTEEAVLFSRTGQQKNEIQRCDGRRFVAMRACPQDNGGIDFTMIGWHKGENGQSDSFFEIGLARDAPWYSSRTLQSGPPQRTDDVRKDLLASGCSPVEAGDGKVEYYTAGKNVIRVMDDGTFSILDRMPGHFPLAAREMIAEAHAVTFVGTLQGIEGETFRVTYETAASEVSVRVAV